jgi:hypothetical protein
MHVQPLNQITARVTDWLWPNRLGLGKVALLDGDPNLGKSFVTLDLCARLSTGRPFPDDSLGPGPCASLILNAEDDAADTILPRLQALGADLGRVFVPGARELAGAPLTLPAQTAGLADAVKQTQARLVVIDPLMAFLDATVVVASDAHARRALAPLADLAERHHCAVLLVRHLAKQGGRRALYRGGGSIGFVGACRSAWLVAADPDHPRHRILAEVKNNLAARQPSLAYEIVAPPGGPPTVTWLGANALTADQLVAAVPPAPRPLPRDRAEHFLRTFLQDGPRTSRDIWAAARLEGLSEVTLERAKRLHEISSVRVWADGKRLSYWLLPGQHLPEAEEDRNSLEPWLASLCERYPSPTPIDVL